MRHFRLIQAKHSFCGKTPTIAGEHSDGAFEAKEVMVVGGVCYSVSPLERDSSKWAMSPFVLLQY